ncbi:hypothetical protein K431DRAFT_108021 [Polychaeton citri CBS 116435]|uniref:Uncharacterized protein n=1 Tax=Polychaeton citri CBS 116435 TaxID=1314669 RepID=A0A9P4Q343_9PEZI|nr:hypothetical protein K431DRAFT_108021 [Polychaeton citri CBS 116435]
MALCFATSSIGEMNPLVMILSQSRWTGCIRFLVACSTSDPAVALGASERKEGKAGASGSEFVGSESNVRGSMLSSSLSTGLSVGFGRMEYEVFRLPMTGDRRAFRYALRIRNARKLFSSGRWLLLYISDLKSLRLFLSLPYILFLDMSPTLRYADSAVFQKVSSYSRKFVTVPVKPYPDIDEKGRFFSNTPAQVYEGQVWRS